MNGRKKKNIYFSFKILCLTILIFIYSTVSFSTRYRASKSVFSPPILVSEICVGSFSVVHFQGFSGGFEDLYKVD